MFANILARKALDHGVPTKGSIRSYLLTATKNLEYRWAVQTIDDTMRALEHIQRTREQAAYYQRLGELIASEPAPQAYEEIAREFGV
jgi:hypothetical protein